MLYLSGAQIEKISTEEIIEKVVKEIEKKVSIWVCDIKGIMYYIDNSNNVYDSEEVMKNKVNPKIIAKTKLKYFIGVTKDASANL